MSKLQHAVVWTKRDISARQLLRGGLLVGVIGVLSCLVSSCGNDEQESALENTSLTEQIIEFNSSVSYEWPLYSSVLETTPHTTFVVDGDNIGPVSDLFVVGKILSVTAGNGYSWPGGPQVAGESSNRAIHEFNSAESWVSTVHLFVSTGNLLYLGDDYEDITQITIGLFLLNPVDLESLKTELEGKRIAAPLHSNEKTAFDLEPGVFGVLRGGELLGFVDESDNVTFPAFDHNLSSDGQPQSIALEDLLNPPPIITIDSSYDDFSGDGNVGDVGNE
ncbi:MAG: hypothetical protein KTV68_10200 [Acidimicrobiia bacterium]|nr:hypothetical protein [Acidimicrobiia bacterium]MCY4432523.1 hypothetical protein [bacterium]